MPAHLPCAQGVVFTPAPLLPCIFIFQRLLFLCLFTKLMQKLFALQPALQSRNYRLLWLSLLISFSGSMMQNATVLWHVALLVPPEQKALTLGLVGLVRIVPVIFFSLLGGVMADAVDRRKVLLVTQSLLTLFALTLSVLTFSGLQSVWPIFALTALSAAANSFDQPARVALIPNLVPRAHLANAISLNSTMFQLAAVIGPALSGIVIAQLSIGWVYLFNAISFLGVIGVLLLMRDAPTKATPGQRNDVSLGAAWEGLRYVFSAPLIRATMLLDFFATFFASASALLPIFAQDILRVGPEGYGVLVSAPALGAFITSAVMTVFTDRIHQRGWAVILSVMGYGLATIIFGFSQWFWLTWLCLFLTGVTDMISVVFRNIIRQLTTPDHLRGRMTSVSMIFFMGGPQLGELEAGLVANWWGAPVSVITGGIACLLATFITTVKSPEMQAYHKDTPLPTPNAPVANG